MAKIEDLNWLKKEDVSGFIEALKSIKEQNIKTLAILKNKERLKRGVC
ncbi:MAG TPA: hypothetical protein PL110_20215 [Candidatus Eremiobacteraeota bacterium]|nr:hypothetical protein [Candidatus Eremiobacteraeota bacterium]